MAGRPDYHYWDSCVFITHFARETSHDADVLAGIRETIERFDRKEISLVTSALTATEILELKNPAVYAQFMRLREHRNFATIACDQRVADRAGRIRNQCWVDSGQTHPDGTPKGMTLTTPDAIHIASALTYGIANMTTLDGKNRLERESLAPLSIGTLTFEGATVNICRPFTSPYYTPSLEDMIGFAEGFEVG